MVMSAPVTFACVRWPNDHQVGDLVPTAETRRSHLVCGLALHVRD